MQIYLPGIGSYGKSGTNLREREIGILSFIDHNLLMNKMYSVYSLLILQHRCRQHFCQFYPIDIALETTPANQVTGLTKMLPESMLQDK